MTAAQNARAAKAVEVTRWLRESSRNMITEGDPGGAMHAARLGLAVAKLFSVEREPVATHAAVHLDEIDAPTRRATYAGLLADEEDR